MKLLPKLALLSFGISALPLAIAGYSSARISQRHLRDAIEEHGAIVARQAADHVASHLAALQATLVTETRVLDLSQARRRAPGADVLRGFLQLVYHQNDDFSAVLALDASGAEAAPAAFQIAPRETSAAGKHEAMRPEDVARARALVPTARALTAGAALGPIFIAGVAGVPHLLLTVRCDTGPDDPPLVLAALVSLRRLADYAAGLSSPETEVLLLDGESRVVAAGRSVGPARLAPKPLPGAHPGALPDKELVAEYESGGRRVIGAVAVSGPFPLAAVVERPLEVALSPLRQLGWSTLYWMSVSGLVAAVVGAFVARSLAVRVGVLVAGARQVSAGKLDTRLEAEARDELGELARAFNAMASSLAGARDEILRQTEEIRSWNESLERRAEEKTRALRDAHDLLLRSRSLAAIGSLGAGVAHEINNPLAGVLGLVQLLLADVPADHPSRRMLEDVEAQALRIQTIVANLLRLTQRQGSEGFRPLDLGKVVEDALELCAPRGAGAGIEVEKRLVRPCPPIRGSAAQLQAALIAVIQNALAAMEGHGRLVVETSLPGPGLVLLRVADTGRGISPEHLPRVFDPFFTTKTHRNDTGIGLSLVHKIVEDHGGTTKVVSEVGAGTTVLVTLPVDPGAPPLA